MLDVFTLSLSTLLSLKFIYLFSLVWLAVSFRGLFLLLYLWGSRRARLYMVSGRLNSGPDT